MDNKDCIIVLLIIIIIMNRYVMFAAIRDFYCVIACSSWSLSLLFFFDTDLLLLLVIRMMRNWKLWLLRLIQVCVFFFSDVIHVCICACWRVSMHSPYRFVSR